MRWIETIVILTFLFMVSCLKQPGNHPPVIEAIIIDPSENFTPGGDITISALVTDQDGDPIEYYWTSSGGVIADPDKPSTSWELYTDAEPLSYENITLIVSDGMESMARTKTIQVSEGLAVWGYAYFQGTEIPVPGVEVTIGKFSTLSDASGYYFIEYLKEGNTVVTAKKTGFKTHEAIVYVDNPRSSYHIPLTSDTETHHVSGVIRTVDNLSFEGLKVVLLNPDGTDSELQGYTDETGSFHIESVPVGTRELLIRNEYPTSHFLNDSMIYRIDLDVSGQSYDARIKVKRTILSDFYLSEKEKWEHEGDVGDGFYMIGRGQEMILREFISVPSDAEDAMFYLNSFVVGGCDLVGKLPTHRVWIANEDNEYMGGISWGGEGINYPAILEWYPSEAPTLINIYGKQIRFKLEVFEENSCVPDPYWRIYQVGFSYYY